MNLTIEQAMQQGVAAQTKGKLQEAEAVYDAILQSQPQHAEANHNLGLIAVAVNNAEAAIPFFKRALDAKPKIGQFWISYIETLINTSQVETAKEVLKQGQSTGLFGNRLDDLDKRLNGKTVGTVESLVQQLLDQFNAGMYLEAEKIAREIITLNPNHQFTWKVFGAVLGCNNKQSEAVYANQKAIELEPNDAESHNNLGNALKELSQLEKAVASFRQALKLKPDLADAHFNLGCILKELDKLKEAEASFQQAIEYCGNDAEFHANMGSVQQQLEKLDEAEISFRKAIVLNPNYAEAFNGLGLTLFHLKKIKQAKRYLLKALELKPSFSQTHNNLGVLYQSQNRFDDAEKNIRNAIALEPDFPEALKNLGALQKRQGKLNDAETTLRSAIALKPNFTDALNELGLTLQLKGNLTEAEVFYKHSLSINPDDSNTNYNLGMLFLITKQYKNAAECFKSSGFDKSKLYFLRCLYLLDDKKAFYHQLDNLIEQEEINPMVGSLVCRSLLRYGVKRENLFCEEPLKYALKTNLSSQCDFKSIFVDTINKIIKEKNLPQKIQGLLSNGFQTHGNLFEIEPSLTEEIQTVIHNEVEKYRMQFEDDVEGLFRHWPKEYTLYGWLVSMKSGGNLKAHMHEKGWISGSVYINVPQKSKPESGNLVVCIEEQQFTIGNGNQNQKQMKSIDVETGSLCLFPASLLHHTIPFESDEERIVLAFDVIPKE